MSRKKKSSYNIYIQPDAYQDRKNLPGHIRQRVKKILDQLAENPRSSKSKQLDVSSLDVPDEIEIYRFRMDKWRLIYAIHESEKWIWIWGIRQRPPYDYDDLSEFIRLF